MLGGLLFAVFGGGEDQPAAERIVISAGQVRHLAAVFQRTWQRPPTEAELEGLIQIPTPRWTAYEAQRFQLDLPAEVPMTTQERAYTSPIWYTPSE